MNTVSSLFGTSGGAGGTGFAGPEQSPITNPVTPEQIQQAYGQTQAGVNNQTNFLAALQSQGALNNQNAAYNQLQNIANGTGPNPAQAQLAQATAANTANQAALMGGQRGSAQNAGLMARQVAMQGAQNQQQSAGQAATLQAQQSLGAIGQMQGAAQNMVGNLAGQTNANMQAAQAQYQGVLNAQSAFNQAQVSNQASVNTANAGLANGRMGEQGSVLGGAAQGIAGAMMMPAAMAKGGKVENLPSMPRKMYADDNGGPVSPTDGAPVSNVATPPQPKGPSAFGRFVNGVKAGNAPQTAPIDMSNPNAALYKGSNDLAKALMQPRKTQQNPQGLPTQYPAYVPSKEAQSLGPDLQGPDGAATEVQGMAPQALPQAAPDDTQDPDKVSVPQREDWQPDEYAHGGKARRPVKALVSPGEGYLSPEKAQAAKAGVINPLKAAEKIGGKPKVPGAKNSYANDTVPKTLEEGGLVLPRSVTQAKNPDWAAKKFVMEHMAKGGLVGMPRKAKGKK